MDLKTLSWDTDIAVDDRGADVDAARRSSASSEVYGEVKTGNLDRHHHRGRPRRPAGGDVRPGVLLAGEAKNTYGTGNFMLLNTGTEAVQSKAGLLTTVGYKIGDERRCTALEGSIAITGALVQWLRDNLHMIKAAPEVEELAKSVDDNGGLYIVPAFSRPVRAVLEVQRPRRVRRPDTVRQCRSHRPRHARGDRVPDPRGRSTRWSPTPASR